jgi:hypothetical protein
VTLAQIDSGDHVHDGSPHLRLVPVREWTPVVKLEVYETDKAFDPVEAPVDQLGPVFSHNIPVVTGNDLDSLLSAFNKRCNFHSNQRVSSPIRNHSLALGCLVFQGARKYDWTDDLFEPWVAKFTPAKQRRMRQALLNLADVDYKRLNTRDLMVKSEVLLKRNDNTWAPRIIYVGSDEFNVLTGPLLNHFNKLLATGLDEFSDPHVEFMMAYGKEDHLIADFLAGDDPFNSKFAEGDFSANDRSHVQDVREIFAYWLTQSGAPDWFVALYLKLAARIPIRNRSYGLFSEIANQLPTGGTDTTSRNTVWNICQWYAYCRKRKIQGTKCAVLGDDIAVNLGVYDLDVPDWIQHCSEAQMILKASHRRFYCDLTFLSRFFVPYDSGSCMVPLICKALCRFNARANRNQDVTDDEYMAGKCLSYAYEFRHVPFITKFFMERFNDLSVDVGHIRLHDLTWFSRSTVSSVEEVLDIVKSETRLLSDDTLLEVVMAKYDLGLQDLDDLCRSIICSAEKLILADERYYLMAHEVA